MKKLLASLSCLAFLLSAVSCGNSTESSEPEKGQESTSVQETQESTESAENTSEIQESTEEETQADETEESTEEESDTEQKKSDINEVDINDYLSSETPNPPLWKATDEETGNELYLMGTIHVVGENTFPLDDKVNEIYQNCDGIAVEYNTNKLTTDMKTMQEFASNFVYTDGSTIKDHISEETYEKAKNYLSENNQYIAMLDYYTAGYWYNTISLLPLLNLKNIDTVGVDAKFMQDAESDGKEIVDIETLETQASLISGFSDELCDFMISAYIDEYNNSTGVEELAESFSELYNLWAVGDDDAMLDIEDETDELEIPDEIQSELDEYEDRLLKERNEHMAERASEFIKDGKNYFFMVGSLHFAGDEGVDDLLREMGYKVEKIS